MFKNDFRITKYQNTSPKPRISKHKYHFCIFHKNVDVFVESNLVERLEVDEKRVYLPSKCDIPGKTWFDNLDIALQNSAMVIILLSEEFLNDGWCRYITEKVIVSKELKSVIFGVDRALGVLKLPLHLKYIASLCKECLDYDSSTIGNPINQVFFESLEQNNGQQPGNSNHGWFRPFCGSIMKVMANISNGWMPKSLFKRNESDQNSLFRDHLPQHVQYDVCIIHSSCNELGQEILKNLVPSLDDCNKRVFSTAQDLPPGKPTAQAIIEAMAASKCTALLLTEATIAQFGPNLVNIILQLGLITLSASFILLEVDTNCRQLFHYSLDHKLRTINS